MPAVLAAIPAALAAALPEELGTATFLGVGGTAGALLAGASTLALSGIASLLTQAPKSNAGLSRQPFSMTFDAPRTWCYGRGATGGRAVYWETIGDDNHHLWFVIQVQDTGADGIEGLWVENNLINFVGNAATNVFVKKDGTPLMFRYDQLGSSTQSANSQMVAASADGSKAWTTQHKLQGVAYFVWHLVYNGARYTAGIPTPTVVLRGRHTWDPRQDTDYGGTGSQSLSDESTWTWNQNAALALLDYLLGVKLAGVRIGGCGVPVTSLDISSFIAAANVCDEEVEKATSATNTVTPTDTSKTEFDVGTNFIQVADTTGLYAGMELTLPPSPTPGVQGAPNSETLTVSSITTVSGVKTIHFTGNLVFDHAVGEEVTWTNDPATPVYEARYTINGFVDAIEDKQGVVLSMLQAMDGMLVLNGGLIQLIPGAAQSTVMSLNDDDLAGALVTNPTVSRQEKSNAVTAVYPEPSQVYQVVSSPPLIVSDYETADGGIYLQKEIKHRFSTSLSTVQRLNKLLLANEREQLQIDAIWKPKAVQISVGQTFNFSSDVAGYSAQKMLCLQRDLQEDGSVRIIARQETDAKYSWATSEEQAPPNFLTGVPLDASIVPAPLSGDVSASGTNIAGADGATIPAIAITANLPPNPFVTEILWEWRLSGTTAWAPGPSMTPVDPIASAYLHAASPNVSYDVHFAYQTRFGTSSWTEIDSVLSGEHLIANGATDGSIAEAAIADGAVTKDKLATPSVDAEQIYEGAISASHLDDALNADLAQVTANTASILAEAEARISSNSAIVTANTASDAALRALQGDVERATTALLNIQTLIPQIEQTYQRQLTAYIQGLTGSDVTDFAARLIDVESATIDLKAGKADTSALEALDAQINTPSTGLEALVSTLAETVALLDPSSATATLSETVVAVRGVGLDVADLGSTILQILSGLHNLQASQSASLAYYRNEITTQVTQGLSANADAIGQVGTVLTDGLHTLTATVTQEITARTTLTDAMASETDTLFAALTGLTASGAVQAAITDAESVAATANSATSDRVTTLEDEIDNPTTGLSATATVANSAHTAVTDGTTGNAALASLISGAQTAIGDVSASGYFSVSTQSTPGDAEARIALLVSATSGGTPSTAALFMDALSDGTSRIIALASQFFIASGSDAAALSDAFEWVGGTLLVKSAVIPTFEADKITTGTLNVDDLTVTGTFSAANLDVGAASLAQTNTLEAHSITGSSDTTVATLTVTPSNMRPFAIAVLYSNYSGGTNYTLTYTISISGGAFEAFTSDTVVITRTLANGLGSGLTTCDSVVLTEVPKTGLGNITITVRCKNGGATNPPVASALISAYQIYR